jgi:hypothetical protein
VWVQGKPVGLARYRLPGFRSGRRLARDLLSGSHLTLAELHRPLAHLPVIRCPLKFRKSGLSPCFRRAVDFPELLLQIGEPVIGPIVAFKLGSLRKAVALNL